MQVKRIGSRNCVNCDHYLKCKDDRKSIIFVCERHRKTDSGHAFEAMFMSDTLGEDIRPRNDLVLPSAAHSDPYADMGGFDAFEALKSVVNDKRIVSPDIKIPEDDFPEAPNFYKYCVSDQYLDQKPFLEQALMGVELFSEFCPRCTDMEWFDHTHRVNDSLTTFERKVALFEHGKCPHCGMTRLQAFKKKLMHPYYELAACCGQRCVVGSTVVLTSEGLMEIGEYSHGRDSGFSTFRLPVHNGKELEETSDFYVSKSEDLLRVRTHKGPELTGTKDHPVLTISGFKQLKNLQAGDYLPVVTNQQVFGNKVGTTSEYYAKSDLALELHCLNVPKAKNVVVNCQIRDMALNEDIAKLAGFWVAEGRGAFISNFDEAVLAFCESAMQSIFTKRYVKRYFSKSHNHDVGVKIVGKRGFLFWQQLMGQDLMGGSAKKSVPLFIRQGPKSFQTAFLQGLFEGDGGTEKSIISWTTISKRLNTQVSAMLNNLGIKHRTSRSSTWASNGTENQVSKQSYVVVICGEDMRKFQEIVGFLSVRKQRRLAKVLRRHDSREVKMSFFSDKLPPQVKEEFLDLLDSLGESLKEFRIDKSLYPRACVVKPGSYMGLWTILGYSGSDRGTKRLDGTYKPRLVDSYARMRAHNVPLTKRKLSRMLREVLKYESYLTPEQRSKVPYFEAYLDPDIWYARVDAVVPYKASVTYDFTLPTTHRFVSNGLVSHNSGKSAWFGMAGTYLTHRVIKLGRPNEVYKLLKANVLQGTMVALTYAQAKDTLWEPFYGNLVDGPWWQRYHAMLDDVGSRYGEELYTLKDTFVNYRHRRVYAYPAGPDKRVLRGRCLTGSALVNTNGGFFHFSELISAYGQVPTTNLTVDSHLGQQRVSHTYKDKDRVVKVTTRNGYSLSGTEEHPLLVLQPDLTLSWVRLEDLKVGDWIVSRTKDNSPAFGSSPVNKDVATLLGYHVANGYRNTISSDDPDVVKTLYKCFKRITGLKPHTHCGIKGVRAATHYLSTHKLGIYGTTFCKEYFEPLGYSATSSRDKSIPLGIRTASREILHEFLEAYFQCDSGINGGAARNSAPSEVEVGSASKKLATQLHVILLHMYGIVGRLKRHVCNDRLNRKTGVYDATRSHWVVTITGYDAYLFLKTFRRAKVQKYAHRVKYVFPGYCSDRRSVPYVRAVVTSIYENSRMQDGSGKTLRSYLCENGDKISKRFPRPTFIVDSRRRNAAVCCLPEGIVYDANDLRSCLSLLARMDSKKTKKLTALLDREAHYEEVVSIDRSIKKRTVYDVTVPGSHAFTANGLVSHNTRYLCAIDELGWFPNDVSAQQNVKMNANEVYVALENSLGTVRQSAKNAIKQGFYNVPFGYFMNISSPSSMRDKIMELVRKSQHSRVIMGIQKATWEMNPTLPRKSDFLREKFRADPVGAMRDFGAQPPITNSPFIANADYVEQCFSDKKNNIQVSYHVKKSKRGDQQEIYGQVDRIGKSGRRSVLAIDGGYSNNSFAVAVGHLNSHGTPVISLVAEIIPEMGIPIQYSLSYTCFLLPIIASRNVIFATADRWNSLKILSDMETELGLGKQQYSLKYADMQMFKSYLCDGQLLLPKPTMSVKDILAYDHSDYPNCFKHLPADHLVLQCLTVQDTGSQVLKGDALTDDILRATMLCTTMLLDETKREELMGPDKAIEAAVDVKQLMFSRGYSSGSAGVSMGDGGASAVGLLRSRT